MSDLFRREAIEHRRQRLYGEVVFAVPLNHWAVTGAIAVSFMLLVWFLVAGSYARRETVLGQVMPDRGVVRVRAQDDGVVESVLVSEGQEVEAGTPLVNLRLDTSITRGESFGTRIRGELNGERRQLEEQIDAATAQIDGQESRLRDDIADLKREVFQYRQQIAVNALRTALAQRQVDDRAPYVREGVVSRADADKLEDSLLAQRQAKEVLVQDLLVKEHRMDSLRREFANLPQVRRAVLATLRERLFALDQRITQALRRDQVVLTAPVSGRVAGVHRTAGETTKAGVALFDLLPKDGKLQVELFAPTRAIAFVAPGSEVQLRYDAFPYQKFGVVQGRVVRVSEAPVDGQNLPRSLAADEPVYRVTVALERDHVDLAGRSHMVRSGMTLKADFIVERRSVAEHLFAPVFAAFERG
jgi:membrane fusion protein